MPQDNRSDVTQQDGGPSQGQARQDGEGQGGNSEKQEKERRHTPALEWATAILGLVLLLGSVGFLLYDAITALPIPADVVVRIDQVVPLDDKYLVSFVASNNGGATAAGLLVEGVLKDGGEQVETSTATVDYVPAASSRSGGLYFTLDPREYTLELRAVGFEEP